MTRARPLAGFTLVELLLALGLFALLMVAVVRLLDGGLRAIAEGEAQRDHLQLEFTVAQWLERDLGNLAAGGEGDFLVDWWTFDHDGDGVAGRPWPRLRLVRRAAPSDLARLEPPTQVSGTEGAEVGTLAQPPKVAYLEVVWIALPAPRLGEEPVAGDGVLWRGERLLGAPGTSFFAPEFLDGRGYPPAASLKEVAAGLLHFDLWIADETSDLTGDWQRGTQVGQVASAWDGRGLGRPDPARHPLNALLAAPSQLAGELRLPRRVRVALEFERPQDRARRPRLAAEVDAESAFLPLSGAHFAPEPGTMVLVGEEWMELLSTERGGARVRRALRGTRASVHPAGAPLSFGRAFGRDVAPPARREDWSR